MPPWLVTLTPSCLRGNLPTGGGFFAPGLAHRGVLSWASYCWPQALISFWAIYRCGSAWWLDWWLASWILAALIALLCWRRPDILVRVLLYLPAHFLYRIRVFGLKNIPSQGPALFVCNHVSFIDAFLVFLAQQRLVRFVVWAPYTRAAGPGILTSLGSRNSNRQLGRATRHYPVVAGGQYSPRQWPGGMHLCRGRDHAAPAFYCRSTVGLNRSSNVALLRSSRSASTMSGVASSVTRAVNSSGNGRRLSRLAVTRSALPSVNPYHRRPLPWKSARPFRSCPPTVPLRASRNAGRFIVSLSTWLPGTRSGSASSIRIPARRTDMGKSLPARASSHACYGLCSTARRWWVCGCRPVPGGALRQHGAGTAWARPPSISITLPPRRMSAPRSRQCNLRHVISSRQFLEQMPFDPCPDVQLIYLEDFRCTSLHDGAALGAI